jgi:hypothetical protein
MRPVCVRCGQSEAPQPLGYCRQCAGEARAEARDGVKRLGEYLTAWAAFDEWLRERGPESP